MMPLDVVETLRTSRLIQSVAQLVAHALGAAARQSVALMETRREAGFTESRKDSQLSTSPAAWNRTYWPLARKTRSKRRGRLGRKRDFSACASSVHEGTPLSAQRLGSLELHPSRRRGVGFPFNVCNCLTYRSELLRRKNATMPHAPIPCCNPAVPHAGEGQALALRPRERFWQTRHNPNRL